MKPFQGLPIGAVQPRGWLRAQLRRDLESGFAGRLDLLTPHAAHDLFRERIATSDSHLAWWDAETRGNWLWGYVMMASLADHSGHRARAAQLVEDLLATRDDDGYIGIYSPAERYRHAAGENGELWAQSRALLALAAHSEASGDERLLAAIRRAVDRTLRAYPEHVPYFTRGSRLGRDLITGLTHGLCYLDVLEWLHDRTRDPAYARAGSRFYREFSGMARPFANDDLALPSLLDPGDHFGGHAVHTAEHLRALLWAHALAPAEIPDDVIATALRRFDQFRLPSGALLGDENIHGVPHPEAAYEYCTMTELAFSLSRALELLGDAAFGDWLEVLVFNAAQGARFPDGSAIAYLSADTRLAATADRADAHSAPAPGRRYKYSPTHDDVACCCNPNAVRLLPQFISRMWLRLPDDQGFAAVAYGPCELHTFIGGIPLTIVQQTAYPFGDAIELQVLPARPAEFTLALRQPAWDGHAQVSVEGTTPAAAGGWWRIGRRWHPGDRVRIEFDWRVRAEAYANGEVAVLRGPLQYALPLRHRLTSIRDYPLPGLHDYDVRAADIADGYRIPLLDARLPDFGCVPELRTTDAERPWDEAPRVLRLQDRTLVPLGCTVLRRAAFPIRE